MSNYNVSELIPSKKEWIDAVLNDFDAFLKDHADCERKASGMAMSLVAKYPDRKEILQDLIHTGIEELEHFKLVYKIMENRGIGLNHKMTKDLYVDALLKNINGDKIKGLRDRLLIAAIVENRGFERFKMISENIQDEELAKFYEMIYVSEAKHGDMFLRLAENYFSKEEVETRYNELVEKETEVLDNLTIAAALH
jgi:tRNA-(ms[2]io[6]A)-hydroxylase